MNLLAAPFPYFGGKTAAADIVWKRFGNIGHYIEPFFGSGAVLLKRPDFDPMKHTETINDKDCFVANVWRAIQRYPEETAKVCDWPVNHADLCAARKFLLEGQTELKRNLIEDIEYCDVKRAGWWIWAASCWIGSGLTDQNARPHLGNKGIGVHKASLIGPRPHLGNKGIGVHKASKRNGVYEWFEALSERLRNARVVCGDWKQVCGGDWQDDHWPDVGIFFDPPYAVKDRSTIYSEESFTVADAVRKWVIDRGKRPSYRIIICGYDEHDELAEHGWKSEEWKTIGGYANTSQNKNAQGSQGKANCGREKIWFSPYCVPVKKQKDIFDLLGGGDENESV